MDQELFKQPIALAGLAGVALAVVMYIFREVIRKNIFPTLTRDQAYRLLNRIVTLIFVIGVLGLVAHVFITWAKPTPKENKAEEVRTTLLRGYVRDINDQPIQGAVVSLDEFPGITSNTPSDGSFVLKDIPSGTRDGVQIRVVKEGYYPNPCFREMEFGRGDHVVKLSPVQKESRLPC